MDKKGAYKIRGQPAPFETPPGFINNIRRQPVYFGTSPQFIDNVVAVTSLQLLKRSLRSLGLATLVPRRFLV